MLRLRTLGTCALERDGVRVDGLGARRKPLALLALLAVAGERGMTREAVAALLWPEVDEERAATSLKQAVRAARQQLGAETLLGPAVLRLNPALCTSDVAEFRAALAAGALDAAVRLYEGPFLDGLLVRGADEFERWAATERAALDAAWRGALETLATRAVAAADHVGAIARWRQLQAADPLNGRVAAGLMRALDAAGDRAGALRHARVHAELLRAELGPTAHDPAVHALAEALAAAPVVRPSRVAAPAAGAPPRDPPSQDAPPQAAPPAPAPVAPTPVAPAPRRRAVGRLALLGAAVLGVVAWVATASRMPGEPLPGAAGAVAPRVVVVPFANTSGDRSVEPLADGLTDELIGALARVPGLRVVPRSTAFALKGRRLRPPQLADSLRVTTVLEGSVRRLGDRVRVTVALASAAEDRVLWSDAYEIGAGDVLAVEDAIARGVVRALRPALAASTAWPSARMGTADPEAHEQLLLGQFYRRQQTPDALARAMRHFEAAIARDSGFARAHAGLANVLMLRAVFADRRPSDELPRALREAGAALALDSTVADAQEARGHLAMTYEWDFAQADARLTRAVELDPAATTSRLLRAIALLDRARFVEAEAQLRQARADDPLSAAVRMTLGRVYLARGEHARAIVELRAALDRNPRLALAQQLLGHALLAGRQRDSALAAFRRAASLGSVTDSAQLAYALARTGHTADARALLDGLLRTAGRRYLPPAAIATAHAGLGDVDLAFRWLERAVAEHAPFIDCLAISPGFEALRGDPRWATLLRRVYGPAGVTLSHGPARPGLSPAL